MGGMGHVEFAERAWGLRVRGVIDPLVFDLRWCGNMALIAEVEQMSDGQIAELNAAYVVRH